MKCEGGYKATSSIGANGGSGGGRSCPSEGDGAPGGSAGNSANRGCYDWSTNYGEGSGQGSSYWTERLNLFKYTAITPGPGGNKGTSSHQAGGGGGGIFLNGYGPKGADGAKSFSGKGGQGYGGGGGAGGYDKFELEINWAGGDGADGLVFIEWDI